MARFRHLHAAEGYDWQQGRPLVWGEWATSDPESGQKAPDGYPANDINDHSSAVVHHGEKRYGLEVMPIHYLPAAPWTWGIHEHRNSRSSLWDMPEVEDKYKGEWLNWTSSGEWDHPEGSPAQYYGHAATAEEAQRAAEENWEKHKAHVDAQNPLKNGLYDGLDRRGNGLDDEDYGHIFGDRS